MSSKFLKQIFSVENLYEHGKAWKRITIFGFKISFSIKNFHYYDESLKKCEARLKLQDNTITNLNKELISLKDQYKNFENIIYVTCDVKSCKPASGKLRELQLLRAKALKYILRIFEKNNLSYWLDFGTLIGALRHKGFIPWDDDIDIAMERSNYERAINLLINELEYTDLRVDIGGYGRAFFMRIIDKNSEFVYFDVYPFDFVFAKQLNDIEVRDAWRKMRKLYQEKYPLEGLQSGTCRREDSLDYMFSLYRDFNIIPESESPNFLIRGIDSATYEKKPSVHPVEHLYPLQKMQFEDMTLNVPNCVEEYLQECDDGRYGNIWDFPNLSKCKLRISKSGKSLEDIEFRDFIDKKNKILDNLLML